MIVVAITTRPNCYRADLTRNGEVVDRMEAILRSKVGVTPDDVSKMIEHHVARALSRGEEVQYKHVNL